MNALVGFSRYGEEQHDRIVHQIGEQELFYRQQLQPKFQQMVRWWKLYLADRDDKRGEHEKWRANVFVPYPYSGVETVVASVSDIMNSADPVIQAEGVGLDDEKKARAIERIIDYTLRKNSWAKTQDQLFRSMCVQGTTIPKLIWTKRSRVSFEHPTQQEIEAFRQAVAQAVAAGAPPPPDDPQQFEVWRQAVMQQGVPVAIPDLPIPHECEYIEYRGPAIDHPQIYDLRFDPQIADMQDQELVIHRMVKTEKWLLERSGNQAWQPFDLGQVQEGLGRTQDGRFSQFEQEIADMLGITNGEMDPLHEKAVELWECWRPNEPEPYCVILNRKVIINKAPTQMPYWHGKIPFLPIRNVCVPGHLLGISELQQPERLYYEMNSLRNLRLDAVTLAVLPAFLKQREVGLPEMQRYLKPGGIIESSRADALQQLTKFGSDIGNAFHELDTIKGDIDETNATPSLLRGSPSTVSRVSATETERRFNQALTRQKQRVLRIEDELQPLVPQLLMLWYQFGDPMIRVQAGGGDPDALAELPRETFLEAVEMDFRFRGATKALNKDLQIQQLMGFLRDNKEDMIPRERRAMMRRIYETTGQNQGAEIVSDQGTEMLQQQFDTQYQLQQMQAQMQAQQIQMQQMQMEMAQRQAAAQAAAGVPPQGQEPPQQEAAEPQQEPAQQEQAEGAPA